MNKELREAIFEHEMFEPQCENSGFPIKHIRQVESTWSFSEEDVENEVRSMLEDGLIEYFNKTDSNSFRSTLKGKIEREKIVQSLGQRHQCLIDQTANIEDLVLALITSSHLEYYASGQGIFNLNTLPIYLWKIDRSEISEAVKKLESKSFFRRDPMLFSQMHFVYLEVDGRIEYKKVSEKLGINPDVTILHPKIDIPEPEPAPDFPEEFSKNLKYRWEEAERCRNAEAWLAAVIIYGSILETVLLGKLLKNKSLAYSSKKAPKDKTTNKPKAIEKWKFEALIDVANDIGWIDTSLMKHSHVLRDARNLVHPHKQVKEANHPNGNSTNIARQIVISIIDEVSGK